MKRSGALVIAGAVLICAVLGSLAQGAVIYVDVSAMGANTGASWGDAFTYLQSGLDAALPNSDAEIWVAAGMYKPTKEVGGTGSRYRAFQLKNGVEVYGGFNGTETDREQRDWETNQTILSGDLNGNDNQNILDSEPTRQDNCYHIFHHNDPNNLINNTAILDGCIITGANAVYNNGGGAMRNIHASPTIRNCTFTGNSSDVHGGGIHNWLSSSPVIINCVFMNNWAMSGGGMFNTGNSNPFISSCTFYSNSASISGGGIMNTQSSPTITNSIFRSNQTSGIDNRTSSSPKITNCLFLNNKGGSGGGISNSFYSKPAIINCTFWGNSGSKAGGISNNICSVATITNSILWGNFGAQIYDSNNSSVVSYCDIQGGWTGTGNVNLGPNFVSVEPNYINLQLQAGSPCIDKGSNAAIPTGVWTDLSNSPRVLDGNEDGQPIVDMGAYEYGYDPTIVTMPYFSLIGGVYNSIQTTLIFCGTPHTTIRYTVDGSDPDEGMVYEPNSLIVVDRSMTLKAKAWKGALTPSAVASVSYTVIAATPTFSKSGGTYNAVQTVAVSCATTGATIRYTTNGINPTEEDPEIASGASITVDHSMTLKARAWKGGMTPSAVQSATYTLMPATPTFSKSGGTYNAVQAVAVSCATAGATIRYTTNGIDPTEEDPEIASGASITVDHSMTLKARAWKDEFDPSAVKSATYTLVTATPVFSRSGGTYNAVQAVAVSCATAGATIRYTTNGIDPTEEDPVIASGASITVDHSMTLKARAWKDGFDPSAVKSATYTLVAATPAFSKSGGTYNTEQTIVITCATPGATIRYTLDGSDPDEGVIYDPNNVPVVVDHTLTLKARAWKEGFNPSTVKSATYTLVTGAPVFSKAEGTYNAELMIEITCATPGATIRYTLDGSDPNEGVIYEPNVPVVVDHTLTLKAKAWREGLPESAVRSAVYTLAAATPVFAPDEGRYSEDQIVTITCATPGAAIYYTTDGSDPTQESTIVEQGGTVTVSIEPETLLKAIAYKADFQPSSIKQARYRLPDIIYVNASATGTNTGANWTDAFRSLQLGLDAVEPNSPAEIWVAGGTYKPTREVGAGGSRYRSFQMEKMVGVYGGFAGTEIRRKQRDWEANLTILSGDLNGDDNDVVLPTEPTRQDNCYHVINNNEPNGLNSTAILDGFVITGGNANTASGDYRYGGGVFNGSFSSPTIAHCIFRHNTAYYGGGIHNDTYSSPLIIECSFMENSSFDGGGGIHQGGNSSPVIRQCVFVGNSSGVYGGGIYNEEYYSSVIDQCIFYDNSATYGGGMTNISSSPTVTNCLFSSNSATEGGGVYNRFSDVTVVNCTFWNNSAQLSGGGIGIYNYDGVTRIANSVFWNNTAPSGPQLDQPDTHFIVSYSNIEGGWAGEGNIDLEPQFMFVSEDPNTLDLRLQSGSPCIDAGNNGAIFDGILSDLDGTLRMIDADCDGNAVVDMGAYEYFLPGDLNFNCGVDITDFDVLSDHMLQERCTCPTNCGQADIDRNGVVEQADLVLFIEQWLQWENITLAPLPSPIVWWKMDEKTGTVVADSAGGRDGQALNVTGTPWVAGRLYNALKLDGVDDYVDVAGYGGILGTASRTCTAWIKTSVVGKDQTILSWGTSSDGQKWMLRVQADGKLAAAVWGGYIQGNTFVADGQWHHVAAVLMDDGSPNVEEIKLYVDGIPQVATYIMAQIIDTIPSQYVQIGSVYNGAIQKSFFKGLIDDARIYDVPLTGEQILRVAME